MAGTWDDATTGWDDSVGSWDQGSSPATVPGPPTNIIAVASDSQAQVSWSAPTSDGGAAVSGYTITASPGGASQTVSAATFVAVFTGLTNGTAYTFALYATNSVGNSVTVNSNTVTPQAAAPPIPTPSILKPKYRVVIAAINGAELGEVQVSNLQYGYALNDPGGLDFVMNINDPLCTQSLLDPGKREVHVYRENTLVWGGYLWIATPSLDEGTVRFGGEGYLSRLAKRHIDSTLTYNQVDQFQIAWNLIAFTQAKTNGDLGFTRFSAAGSGVLRDRSYKLWERSKILDMLQELGGVINGFDFEITPTKQWKNYYPTKGSVLGLQFELGKNIDGLSYDIDASDTATVISAIGAGEGAGACIADSTDATAKAAFGLLEDEISLTDIKQFATLQEHADTELALRKGARWQPQLNVVTDDPPFGYYSVGDYATIKASQGYIQLNNSFRIVTILVQVDNEGQESYQITFDGITA